LAKERLDVLLVKRGYAPSREQARRTIMAGLVRVGGERADKPGVRVPVDASIEVEGPLHPYVSRGGLKLEEALRVFSIDLTGRVVIDIGASTGGFTDCALQKGARIVYAVDVGYGQLAWKLRQDPRVVVMERTNFRHFRPEDLKGERPDVGTVDVSFISLAHILPPLARLLSPPGEVVALVKPQFEAGKEQVGKGGIVRDPAVHRRVLMDHLDVAAQSGFRVLGLTPSPIAGGEGNIEFLSHLILASSPRPAVSAEDVERVVEAAHRRISK
jgi:23S rRNA (cytidine1920-2'-O)/16S rRNA (cytidine1409-2'-O)-methyltransferase